MTFPKKTEGGLFPKRAEDGGGHAIASIASMLPLMRPLTPTTKPRPQGCGPLTFAMATAGASQPTFW